VRAAPGDPVVLALCTEDIPVRPGAKAERFDATTQPGGLNPGSCAHLSPESQTVTWCHSQ